MGRFDKPAYTYTGPPAKFKAGDEVLVKGEPCRINGIYKDKFNATIVRIFSEPCEQCPSWGYWVTITDKRLTASQKQDIGGNHDEANIRLGPTWSN